MIPVKTTIYIGTSNIALPVSKTGFPSAFREKSRLHYYSSLFNSLEVNSSFSRIPLPSTLEKWVADVPADFRFTVKLWKEITHAPQLQFIRQDVNKFMDAVKSSGVKKGCLLVQFPGSTTYHYYKQLVKLLKYIAAADSEQGWRLAVEFRSATWYTSKTYRLLDSLKACMVLHDMPKSKPPEHHGKANFAYYRYHGPNGDYRGSYPDEFLQEQAVNLIRLANEGKEVYAYFNNTMGSAYDNAERLKTLLIQGD